MDVFQFRGRLVGDDESFTGSYTKPQASNIKNYLNGRHEAGVFWPAPLIQLNPRKKKKRNFWLAEASILGSKKTFDLRSDVFNSSITQANKS